MRIYQKMELLVNKIAVIILLCVLATQGERVYKLMKMSRKQQALQRHHRYFEESEELNTVRNEDDPGLNFERGFETNHEEFVNFPVKPASPLPSWLRGSLVSTLALKVMLQESLLQVCSNTWING